MTRRLQQITIFIFALLTICSISYADKPKLKVFQNGQQSKLLSMEIEGVNAFYKDIIISNDPDSPITCGIFQMDKGKPLNYEYSYDEATIILEGEMTLSEEGGNPRQVKAGDLFYIEKGAKITYTSESSGLGFYCGQRSADGV